MTHISPQIHGQSQIARTLVEHAREWDHVRLVAVNTPYSLERESLVGFKIRKVARLIRNLRAAVSAVRRTRAHVVIVTPGFYAGAFLKDAIVICTLRALSSARIVAWVHMDPVRLGLDDRAWWYRRFASLAIRQVSCWVACAPTLLDQWPSFIPRERRAFVTNGTSAPARPHRRAAEREAANVCFLSSMESSKGWTDLVEAAEQLCATSAHIEFHFYGDVGHDATSASVSDRFARSSYPTRIVWHGPVRGDAKWRALLESHLFCFPSRTEQFPLVVLEAMACRLPIVTTRVGAVEDAVVDGQGGWFVVPSAPGELVSAIKVAFEDRDRLVRFGEFNRSRYEHLFSAETFASEWERLLTRVVAVGSTESVRVE